MAREVGVQQINGRWVDGNTPLWPLACCLPMGWAWPMFFCQRANALRLANVPELRGSLEMRDRGPPLLLPSRGLGRYTYVDNLGVVGCPGHVVSDALAGAERSFEQAGLALHKTELGAVEEALGVELDGEAMETRATHKRFWRVRLGLLEALRRRRISGLQLEVSSGAL